VVIIFNFDDLFSLVINFTTKYSEPLIGILFCLFAGWVWNRNQLLSEIQQGMPMAENSLFWKIWPSYVRFVCPLIVLGIFIHSIS